MRHPFDGLIPECDDEAARPTATRRGLMRIIALFGGLAVLGKGSNSEAAAAQNSTRAMGEEGGVLFKTQALSEQGGSLKPPTKPAPKPIMTQARLPSETGGGGGKVTTQALGEEGGMRR